MPEPLVKAAGLLDDETGLHILPLSMLLLARVGPECFDWSSEALHAELEEMFGSIGIVTWERIQAARVLHAHDAYWTEWEVFEKVTAAICGEVSVFHLAQPPEAAEIAVSLSTAAQFDVHSLTQEVQGYVVAACLTDGLWYFESPISNAVRDTLSEFDQRMGIVRPASAVADELERSPTFRDPAEDEVSVQVNRVLDVREVLRLYNEAVAQQLKALGH